jgi:hypothetical protein
VEGSGYVVHPQRAMRLSTVYGLVYSLGRIVRFDRFSFHLCAVVVV